MSETIVREARLSDQGRLRTLYEDLDRFHVQALPGLFRPVDDPAAARHIAQAIEDRDTLLLVAEMRGVLVALAGARVVEIGPDNPVYVPRRFVYVEDMVVLPEYRGRGVGRALLGAVEEWARQRDITAIELTVFEFNEGARALYERVGFETVLRRMRKEL